MIVKKILKADYKPFVELKENKFQLMINRKSITKNAYSLNENGDYVMMEEKKDTDYCSVVIENMDIKPSMAVVSNILKSLGYVDLKEAVLVLQVFEGDIMRCVKDIMLHNIETFDTSPAVNGFLLNGSVEWIDIDLRVKLCTRTLPEEKKAGKTSTVLWLGNKPYELPIETIEQIMHEIEIYAKACLDVTNSHKAQVLTLSDVSALVAYDYTAGYPEKLSFNI